MEPPAETGRPSGIRTHQGESKQSVSSDLHDDELIQGALSAAPGDTRSFDELVRRHQGHIRANCRFIVEDPEFSLDLAQETFVKAYFGLASFEGRSSFRTWLRRIKVNQCLSFLESPRSRKDLRLHESRPEEDPALRVPSVAQERAESNETQERVVRTLDRLPESLRTPLVLRDMDGFSYREIKELLGIDLSAVKMRIFRAREAFRDAWEKEEERTG